MVYILLPMPLGSSFLFFVSELLLVCHVTQLFFLPLTQLKENCLNLKMFSMPEKI